MNLLLVQMDLSWCGTAISGEWGMHELCHLSTRPSYTRLHPLSFPSHFTALALPHSWGETTNGQGNSFVCVKTFEGVPKAFGGCGPAYGNKQVELNSSVPAYYFVGESEATS